jgi:hypothetical protein
MCSTVKTVGINVRFRPSFDRTADVTQVDGPCVPLRGSIVTCDAQLESMFAVTMLLFAVCLHSSSLHPKSWKKADGLHLLFDGGDDGWEVRDDFLSVTERGGENGGTAGEVYANVI